jgi:hypothetical protein
LIFIGLTATGFLFEGGDEDVVPRIGWLVDLSKGHAGVLLVISDGGQGTTSPFVLRVAKPMDVLTANGSAHDRL